jgi:serine/threonine-protein kinase
MTELPDEATSESNSEAIIDRLIQQWNAANIAGRPVPLVELCQSYPELLPKIRSRIAKMQGIDVGGGKNAVSPLTADMASVTLPVHWSIEELEFLQRGGLGAVYVGEDMTAHRRVAVKFLHSHLASDPVCRERFALEAEVTARLEHPGVIPLYGVGENDQGDPFYAMRFIDGQSMDDSISELFAHAANGKSAVVEQDRRYRALLNHMVSVCKTIAYAHNRGIVHRDIKPANIMLGRYGETIVVDWGLAVPVVRDETFRQSGEKTLMPPVSGDSSTSGKGAGTPAYMSPEQASQLDPTPASDIYSLGATLYKVCSGKVAVSGDSIDDIKRNIIDGRINPINHERSSVPSALASITRKAMSLRPTDRYSTALEMAEDIEAFLADDRVSAHREAWLSKLIRISRRHRAATKTAVLAIVLGAIAATVALFMLGAYATRETYARRDAELAHTQAVQAQARAEKLGREALEKSAQFLAESIANEIDLRWRILEAKAGSATLRRLINEMNAKLPSVPLDESRDDSAILISELEPARSELQSWLQASYIENQASVKSDSWFAQAENGIQLARVPSGTSIGRSYRHRDYFHGQGYDLDPDKFAPDAAQKDPNPPGPLPDRIVHMSAVYESTNTRTLKVSFSVPVYSGESEQISRRIVGVIGMTVELGDFAMDDNTWLIDTRPDQFKEQRGLLLQHPKLGTRSEDDYLPHLPIELVDKMLNLRKLRIKQARRKQHDRPEGTIMEVVDPIDQSATLVAMEPVIVGGRPDSIADTGWIVVVSEAEL